MGEQEELIRVMLALVKRYRKETPLGHQPHMIAHEADDAIAAAEAALSPQVAPDLPMPPYPFQPLDETGGTNLRGRT